VFYPAVIGWICLGLWLTEIRVRMEQLTLKKENETNPADMLDAGVFER